MDLVQKTLKRMMEEETVKNPRVSHIVYRVMYKLGYISWIQRKMKK